MYTYRDLIRKYAADVLAGSADQDVTDRATRRYLGILLNLASNAGWASVVYPPSDRTRNDVVQAFLTIVNGDLRALCTDAESTRLGIAAERAIEILRNI